MPKEFFVVIEKGKNNNYIGSAVGLYGCRTRAKTFGKLTKKMKSAIKNYLKTDKYPHKTDFTGVRILKTARYKSSTFTVVIEKDGKYYIASVPSLAGCFTQARTIEKLMKNIQEVIHICFEFKKDFERTEFVGVEAIEADL